MNTIYFTLSQNIEQNTFLKKVISLINKQINLNNKILKIEIIDITSENNELIPKLEYRKD